jgi:hypothetical protein
MAGAAYTSRAPVTDRGSATLVVTCSSNAFAPVIREFLEAHLELPEGTYDHLAVPGGPQFLLLTEYLPKFAWAGHRWVKWLVEKHRLKRVVLVTHEDCAWHDDERMLPAMLHRFTGEPAGGSGGAGGREREVADVRRMAVALHDLLPSVGLEAYFAAREADGRIGFSRVA